MFLFFLCNAAFLASFAWLALNGASLAVWGIWIGIWAAADYAVTWITGYEPPLWAWAAILAVLAALWILLASGIGG